MKKTFNTIGYFLEWLLYFHLTIEDRNRYSRGQIRGMHCISSKDVSCILPYSTIEYTYKPGIKPYREYLTWKEFWKARGYYKTDK